MRTVAEGSPATNGRTSLVTVRPNGSDADIEASVRTVGLGLFSDMDRLQRRGIFSGEWVDDRLLKWSMQDPRFKTQLFRLVDVLPALRSSHEVARHVREYLDAPGLELAAPLRLAVRAAGSVGRLVSFGVQSQVARLARRFMVGAEPREIVAALRRRHEEGIGFSVDILGETVVSEGEADAYARRYLELISMLAEQTRSWGPNPSNITPRGPIPHLNVSVKLSALYSQIHPADPQTALAAIAARFRPLLRRAAEVGAFINVDMESRVLKDLTLDLFMKVLSEEEFRDGPPCGIAMQAYLLDTASDLERLVRWARSQGRRITVRLVKGAYWDYETVLADQRNWPAPVFTNKLETDLNYERLSLWLLENEDTISPAFGTHNVRSIAHALAQAERLGVERGNLEFQILHGMADGLAAALRENNFRVREYCPVGELLPGMAYLVRRLLENTSNEGFIASQYTNGVSHEQLLANPAAVLASAEQQAPPRRPTAVGAPSDLGAFRNEPPADFTQPHARDALLTALRRTRAALGGRQPLLINNQPVTTAEWLPSLNPADQREVLVHSARATVVEADAALAAAQSAQPKWARVPAAERAAWLERVAALISRDKANLIAVEILEAGKDWIEADADLAEAIDFCRFYAAVMRDLGRPQQTQYVPGEDNFQEWWPRGVAVVIAPWNFPLAILTGMTVAAAVAGNTVIVKPSERTPLIASRLVELMIEAGAPPGVVNLVTGLGGEVGAHLAAHPGVDLVAFTGSREVGLRIWEEAGRTHPGQTSLKKVICELGGKNALIVDSDADLDEAVAGAVASAFGYQGQKCSALSRLIVLRDCYEPMLERLIAATGSLRIGPAEHPGVTLGPVIDRRAQEHILAMIAVGRQEATLAWQGAVPDEPHACYVPPTIFTGVQPHCRIFREEIFGPVLSISEARDFDEALALANRSEFALTGGLYSRSPVHIERAKRELICGNLYINRRITGAIVGRQPFGGFKMSGAGTKAGGREYLQHFMIPRVVTENCLRRGFAPEPALESDAA